MYFKSYCQFTPNSSASLALHHSAVPLLVRLHQRPTLGQPLALRTRHVLAHPARPMVQRRTARLVRCSRTPHGRVVVRKHGLIVAAYLAQVALARAHRAPSNVPIERLEGAAQMLGQRARLDAEQIGHAVHVRRLYQMPASVHVLLDQTLGGRHPAFVQIAAHLDEIAAQLLHQTEIVHVDEQFGIVGGHMDVGAAVRQLQHLQ